MTSHPVHGTVQSWDNEEGWGVLVSPDIQGEIWAHFSAVYAKPGAFTSLDPGESVLFTWEEFPQDDYSYRAVHVRRPSDPETDWEPEQDDEDAADLQDICIELDPE
ncbi:cold shock domain-containing protein [Streptomyces decoyicus]|nr:cold shock domain-containing protein [Streptomyces decoyicus]